MGTHLQQRDEVTRGVASVRRSTPGRDMPLRAGGHRNGLADGRGSPHRFGSPRHFRFPPLATKSALEYSDTGIYSC